MFDQIFGNYLVHAGRISKEQLTEVIEYEKTVRVKLGLIAVAEKLMTKAQSDEVNKLQAIMDKRFGDIAVEKRLSDRGAGFAALKETGKYLYGFCPDTDR